MIKQTIQIFARIKPTERAAVYSVDNEDQAGAMLEFVVPRDLADGFINNKRENYKFRFKKVFDQAIKQEEIFEAVAKPVADSVLEGYNGTIFAYGQTGSGKTFTITGGAEQYNDRGIIPRTLSYLYQRISQDRSVLYTTHISYLEIYNEVGYDLLNVQREASQLEDLPKVTILEDSNQNIHLRNLSQQLSANEEEALNLLFLGDTNRMTAETPMNQASTRSHCIFTLHLCRREPGSATLQRSKLHLVDLAGSERVSKTGVDGRLLTEAKYINVSLHYLEQVIITLSEKSRSHIPYRNSMMTSVLRDSLGGNCMTTMIANIAIDKRNLNESISTCGFAQRVALIKNEAILNKELDPALLIAHLKREIQSLKDELSMLTGKQRNDLLTAEEIQKSEELVRAFLDDPDPEATLSLGPDMRKIHYCFSLLKIMIRDKRDGKGNDGEVSPTATRAEEVQDVSSSVEQTKLKDMLKQRDDEISILVKVLKKEKKRAEDATTQLAKITRGQSLASQSAVRLPTRPQMRAESSNTSPTDQDEHTTQQRKRGPQLSMGKREAFEIFRRDHESSQTIQDNNNLLKQRTAEARKYGEQLKASITRLSPQLSMGKREAFEIFRRDHESSQTIQDNNNLLKQRTAEARKYGEQLKASITRLKKLKKQIEIRRKQRAIYAVMENHKECEEDIDPEEANLLKCFDAEKKVYKDTEAILKDFRSMIEYLKLMLERSNVKLQKDFQEWWKDQASRLQESELLGSARLNQQTEFTQRSLEPFLDGASGFSMFKSTPSKTVCHDGTVTDSTGSDFRMFSAAAPSCPANLMTGDQQIDDDIRAFYRTRQNMINRNAVVSHHDGMRTTSPPSDLRMFSNTAPSCPPHLLTGDQRVDNEIQAFFRTRQNMINRSVMATCHGKRMTTPTSLGLR
ncbi:kinesin-like protein KIF6 [Thalassophryne amazonica]|uniref:kinesin-like protein KIF6 n=1 Tax=Thalassophryne amazonica TaxID=390379 RepID=UPI0014708BC8|nr:kinesin-like protein KIF6 [Thalassophryne amazonica]